MDRRRRLFLVALIVLLAWIASLATLAAVSSRRPAARRPVSPSTRSGLPEPAVDHRGA